MRPLYEALGFVALIVAAAWLGMLLGAAGCGGHSSHPRPPQPPPVDARCKPCAPLTAAQAQIRASVEACVGFHNPQEILVSVQPTVKCSNGAPGCIDGRPWYPFPVGSMYRPECGPCAYIGTPNSRFPASYWEHALRHEMGHHSGLDPNHTDPRWRSCNLM